MFLSSRQAGYSNRQQRQPRPEYKSDKCDVSGRYFVVGGQSWLPAHFHWAESEKSKLQSALSEVENL